MGLDPASIAQGVVTGIATQKAMQAANAVLDTQINRITGQAEAPQGEDPQAAMVRYLKIIAEALSPSDNPNIDLPMALQPYPYEYVTDPATYGKGHLSIFFHEATPLRADIAGVGTYLKTVGPGWVQCDIWANMRLSTTDSQTHTVIVSYRTDSIGSSL